MRTLEIAFILLASASLLAMLQPPLPSTISYEQQWVLANDIYLEMYRHYGLSIYDATPPAGMRDELVKLSQQLHLCIEFKTQLYTIQTCPIKKGAYIERHYAIHTLEVGVGK